MSENIIALALAYLIGSIPFGLLLTRAAGLGDVRNIGSGNIGATNVMRTGKKWLGVLTLLLDAGKGYLAVTLMKTLMVLNHSGNWDAWVYAAGLAAVLGHVFSVFLKFKGGKGVATAIGVVFGIDAGLGVTVCLLWLLGLAISRVVSVASIECFWFLIFPPIIQGNGQLAGFVALLALLITWTHRSNLKRLKAGQEPKIGKKS